MQRFLDKVSQHICTQHPDNLADVCIVLPNRRAGLFLKKSIPQFTGKTTWSPDIFSIEDFVIKVSGFGMAETTGLLFDLYAIHQKVTNTAPETFDDFISSAMTLISDFSAVDMNMVDAESLFTYLSEAKAIERWNPAGTGLSASARQYLRFYQSLAEYYQTLRSQCEAKKLGYKGLAYRVLAENIESIANNLPWKKIYFAGFNAMTVSEQKIVAHLKEIGFAEQLYDVDDYYLSDKKQEAGHFLRKEIEKADVENFKWIDENFKTTIKKINLVGIPKSIGQAQYAADIIREWAGLDNAGTEELSNAALVLADENLLFPVLNSLYNNTPKFNVTMGFPLRMTIATQFFNQVMRMYENVQRLQVAGQNAPKGFYHNDVTTLLTHPLLNQNPETPRCLDTINASRRVFYSTEELIALVANFHQDTREILELVFSSLTPSPIELIDRILLIIRKLRDRIFNNAERAEEMIFEAEYLCQLSKIFTRLQSLISTYQIVTSTKTLRKLFKHIVQNTTIPFEGEPLTGLQIMGVLETRTLDFDKIILLSANEGIFPSGAAANSFIPPDIQREYALPGTAERNAVSAYHFYRLLQRSSEIHLVFNTEPDELGGGEPSRFIMQLEHELPKYQPAHSITRKVVSLPLPEISGDQEIIIEKDENVLAELIAKGKRGLSPSAINNYRSCSLKFYLAEIAGIIEAEEVEESIDFMTLGNIVHKALEILYLPYINKILRTTDLDEMHSRADEAIALAFSDKYSGGEISYGWNKLISEVIRNFIRQFLVNEKAFLKEQERINKHLTIVALEERVSSTISIPGLKGKEILLKGFIDRVDKVNGILRIIDYKTGGVENKELQFDSWEAFTNAEKNGKALQVLMYAWLYSKKYPNQPLPFNAGIFGMQTPRQGLICFEIKAEDQKSTGIAIDQPALDSFEEILMQIIAELYNREVPFAKTDNLKTCRLCEFRQICHR